MPDTRERDRFLQFLRSRGLRVTQERLVLFEEIFAQHKHIDAEELLAAMKTRDLKISRATVYRNLDLLVDCGLVRKQRLRVNEAVVRAARAPSRRTSPVPS